MRIAALVPLALLLIGACAGPASTEATTVPVSATTAIATSTPSAPTGGPASPTTASAPTSSVPSPARSNPADDDVLRVVRAWSDALDRHDVDALAGLYEDYVRFYGSDTPVSRSTVLGMKRSALGPGSTFRQEIVGEITVVHDQDGGSTARFVKRSGPAGAMREVRAYLVLRRRPDGQFVIWTENDEPTDAAAKTRSAWEEACEATAARVVDERPAVKTFEESAQRAADASHGRARFGGIGPVEGDDDSFGVGIGFHTDDRYEGHVWYSVGRKTGEVKLTVDGIDVDVGDVGRAAVRRVCRR
jgi:ketosteroid isomerase-like protein